MARPKKFNREEVLYKAINYFWVYGFEATSMSDLQRTMGIGRQSLYDTFGNKNQIFEEALGFYINRSCKRNIQLLRNQKGMPAIQEYFETSVNELASLRPRRSCMIFNTCLEIGPDNITVTKQVRHGITHLRQSFAYALKQSLIKQHPQNNNHNKSTLPSFSFQQIPTKAYYLTSQVAGLSVLAKSGASKKEMLAMINILMTAL